MRWQTEKEMVSGKGQFICGNKICNEIKHLRTWEVNFSYMEHGQKKNTLVKLSTVHKPYLIIIFIDSNIVQNFSRVMC